jgi:hypothetical protein
VLLDVWRGHRGHGLGRAEDEASVVAEREAERFEGGPLHRRVEVDEDVPTEDQVDPRERRPSAEVVLTEDHLRPDRLRDLVAAVGLDEVAREDRGGHVLQRRRRVEATPGEGDGRAVDVGREDPHVDRLGHVAHRLEDRDRERIRLLAGRAAG